MKLYKERGTMAHNRKEHWDAVYATKQPHEVSWTQDVPATSLEFIHSFRVPKTASIIDIGGGDSRLVDYLLDKGYSNITVLDISAVALEKARKRLGSKASHVQWVVADITEFQPNTSYDIWHDRATFHFLTTAEQINTYLALTRKAVTGYVTIGTFSDSGPTQCSGLQVRQYSEEQLQTQLSDGFNKIRCMTEQHTTPFSTTQSFLFCSFKRALPTLIAE